MFAVSSGSCQGVGVGGILRAGTLMTRNYYYEDVTSVGKYFVRDVSLAPVGVF